MATTEEIKLKIGLQVQQFKKNLGDLNNQVKKFSGVVKQETNKIQNSFNSTFTKVATFAKSSGFLGILSGGALLAFTKHISTNTKELRVWSQTLGIAENRLEGIQYAFAEVGFGAEKTTDILKDVNDKVGDFLATGGGEAANIFKRLGLSRSSIESKDAIGIIETIQGKIEELNVPIKEQTFIWEALANDLSKASPLLKNNAELLKKSGKESQGLLLGPQARENFIQLDKGLRRLGQSYTAVGAKLLNIFLPGINAGISALDMFGKALNKLIDSIRFADLGKTIGGWLADLREANLDKSGGNLGGAGFSTSDLFKPTQFADQSMSGFSDSTSKMLGGLSNSLLESSSKLLEAGNIQIQAADNLKLAGLKLTAGQQNTAIGKLLLGSAQGELGRIFGGGGFMPQAQNTDFDRIAQALAEQLSKPLATGAGDFIEGKFRQLEELARYSESRGGNVSGMMLVIQELRKFAKSRLGKDDKPKAQLIIEVKETKDFEAKVANWAAKGIEVKLAKEAAEVGK